MYNVYQPWDRLKTCIVGTCYPPEYFSFITKSKVRSVMEKIAEETEEDLQNLIRLLEQFEVTVLRTGIGDTIESFYHENGVFLPPPITPRDHCVMLGNEFYVKSKHNNFEILKENWEMWKGTYWPKKAPETYDEYFALPDHIKDELKNQFDCGTEYFSYSSFSLQDKIIWGDIVRHVEQQGNKIINLTATDFPKNFASAYVTQLGKNVYIGSEEYKQDMTRTINVLNQSYPDRKFHATDTGGHSDGTFCVLKPGLLLSIEGFVPEAKKLFPDWEIISLPGPTWGQVNNFQELRKKNNGKFWVRNEEVNDEFTDFVGNWLVEWIGQVEETVFDVNLLMIDEHNIICPQYNEQTFKIFEKHGITPHIVDFRHRYFWDGGISCVTNDIHREPVI